MRNFVIVLLCLLATSCATKREATEVVRVVSVHDTLRQEVVRTDSVYLRDSVRIWIQGDTIHQDRWRVEYRDRWRDKVRDVVVYHTDTLTQTKEVIVEREQTWWQKFKQRTGGFALALLGICAILLVIKHRIS